MTKLIDSRSAGRMAEKRNRQDERLQYYLYDHSSAADDLYYKKQTGSDVHRSGMFYRIFDVLHSRDRDIRTIPSAIIPFAVFLYLQSDVDLSFSGDVAARQRKADLAAADSISGTESQRVPE